jgi:hypothetical protein
MEYDMMAKGESGHPCLCFDCMRRKGFVLDPTVDKSVRFMQSVFDRHAKMVTILQARLPRTDAQERQFADKTVPRGQIMRRIVEPIRDAVKGRALILGCNYHFDGGMDIVDAVRVAATTFPLGLDKGEHRFGRGKILGQQETLDQRPGFRSLPGSTPRTMLYNQTSAQHCVR